MLVCVFIYEILKIKAYIKVGEGDKPDSVLDNHSSRGHISGALERIKADDFCKESL